MRLSQWPLLAATLVFSIYSGVTTATEIPVDDDGTMHMPAYTLPPSALLGSETHAALKKDRADVKEYLAARKKACPSYDGANAAQMPAARQCLADLFYKSAQYRHLHELYAVQMTPRQIGGVYTEIFTPTAGIASKNQHRVLINVHGGGFVAGARTGSHIESVPIAALGKIKIVSIDYRLAPEATFPAASQDVAAVYRELIKTYQPANIGIYGCSAGGTLTAESLAWFQKERLPKPGAAGMFCAGAYYWNEGDTGYMLGARLVGTPIETALKNPYFKGIDRNDPLAFPGRSPAVLAGFPPSLLITSTRDFTLSSVVRTHSLLVAQGVSADLHIWEGLEHAFLSNPDLAESKQAYSVIVKFFDTHLGT